MPYAICRVSRIKSRAALNSAFRHNYRVDPSSVSNADPTKGIKELYAVPGGTYEAALDAKLAESPYYQGHNVKKGSVLADELLLGVGEGSSVAEEVKLFYEGGKEPEELDRWCEENMKFLKQQFGDGLVGAVLHTDESTPHIHAIVIPMKDGRLSHSSYFGSKSTLSDLQDRYAEAMVSFGLDRGERRTQAGNIPLGRFYDMLNQAHSGRSCRLLCFPCLRGDRPGG